MAWRNPLRRRGRQLGTHGTRRQQLHATKPREDHPGACNCRQDLEVRCCACFLQPFGLFERSRLHPAPDVPRLGHTWPLGAGMAMRTCFKTLSLVDPEHLHPDRSRGAVLDGPGSQCAKASRPPGLTAAAAPCPRWDRGRPRLGSGGFATATAAPQPTGIIPTCSKC